MERIIASFIDDTSVYAQLSGSGSINAILTGEEGEIRGSINNREQVIASFIDDTSIYAQLTESGSINAILTGEEGEIRGVISSYTTGTIYTGDYIVKPKANEEVVLDTSDKILTDDITVLEIPYYETSNVSGYTVYIG